MRPLVRSAVQSSLASVRAEHKKGSSISKNSKPPISTAPKSKHAPAPAPPPAPIDKHASRPKEFAPRTSSAAPRRLNDIAQAPPVLTFKSASSSANSKTKMMWKASSVVSPAQQLQMAAAREAAVRHYRELKAVQRAGASWGADGGERGGGPVGEGEEE
ncbi:hypothetical protein B0H12DRAFT_121502 [Mycena haematopus]|nr:hypothetical protein B0H12DRAFT_121502 [Mycena haematopus]